MIDCLYAAAGGLLLSLAFPPWELHTVAWISFVPLFYSIDRATRPARAALLGAVFGFVFFLSDVRWIYQTLVTHGHFTDVPAAALCLGMILYLSVFPAAFGLLIAVFRKNGMRPSTTAPFVWTGLEYVRAILFTGFPWDLVGYSQVGWLSIVQIADVTGVYGVSFLVVLVNGAIWEALRFVISRDVIRWRVMGTAGLALIATVAYGTLRLAEFSAPVSIGSAPQIAVLQGNIPQELKWEEAEREHTFATYERLGRDAVAQGADLLIWPETSAPVVYGTNDPDWRRPGWISLRLGVPMLVGAPSIRMVNKRLGNYNSAFLADGPMLRYRYDKIHLVPFGEYMPLSWLLPLGPGIAARDADYSAGDVMTVMRFGDIPPFSVLICYEAIFPELARMAVNEGARMLVNITNDGWFGHSAAPYQHLAMAGIRSVENRVWLVRAANTGVSAAFDPAGRMVKHIPLETQGFFVASISSSENTRSFYARCGDVFVWCCVAVGVMLGLSAIMNARRGAGRSH